MEDQLIKWDPIVLTREDLLGRAKFHRNEGVDVCAVAVLDLIAKKIKENGKYLNWYGVSKEQLPGKNNIFVEVGDDAVVIGYPKGFYDEYNIYPIVKSGIIASKWGAYFGGQPYFLIDAKLFPGSSGSIVVSKPKDLALVDGTLRYSKEKQFAFLGVYSGEPIREHNPIEFDDITIIRKSGFKVGVVWYGHLVEDIINDGNPYQTSDQTVK